MDGNSLHRQNMYNEIIVQVQQGKLRGSVYETIYDTLYVAFHCVPYAAPPIGNLRFKDPQPPRNWPGIRDIKKCLNNCCIQNIIWPRLEIIGNESCLHLNIYVPLRLKGMTGIAVMVWIHGTSYYYGSGEFHNAQPDYLMEKNIILVTVNYRLGVFGFFNLNHQEASGNQGLKDQVAALQWIKRNIAAFGGDPNNITLFGYNMGAVCVHLLMLSPLSRDLFHKAILQSGVATMNSVINDNATIEHSYRLASILGYKSSHPSSIITSLNAVSANEIVNVQNYILTENAGKVVGPIFGPSIDKCSERPFLPCSPSELLHNGNHIPVIIGHTSLEFMRFLDNSSQESLQRLYANIPRNIKMFLVPSATELEIETLATFFRRCYFNNQPPTSCGLRNALQCYSDIFFNIPIRKVADIRRIFAEAPTYLYEFSYVGNHKVVNKNVYSYNLNLPVSTQHDDVPYLFFLPYYKEKGDSIFPPPHGTEDFMMIDIMTGMWTQFAKTGHPCKAVNTTDLDWKPATIEKFYYLFIDRFFQLRILANPIVYT